MAWRIPKIWEGGRVWIIGGGPSMPSQFGVPEDIQKKVSSGELSPSTYSSYLKPIHNEHVIAVNAAYKIGNWIDVMLFGDPGFYNKQKDDLLDFPGLKLGVCPQLPGIKRPGDNIKYIARDHTHNNGKGINNRDRSLCFNLNTGGAAINLAAHFGATKIILLGFDMYLTADKKSHWHGIYTPKDEKAALSSFSRHLNSFSWIKRDAKKKGIIILNASPNSRINDFKKINVKDIL